jgi:hypothetical protein
MFTTKQMALQQTTATSSYFYEVHKHTNKVSRFRAACLLKLENYQQLLQIFMQ